MSADNNVTQRRRADDWKKPAAPAMTHDQLGIVLNDVAAMAKSIERFASLLLANLAAGQDEDEAFLAAIEAMAQRIGWASDLVCDRIDGTGGAVHGDAEKWMMPPSFHRHQAAAGGVAE